MVRAGQPRKRRYTFQDCNRVLGPSLLLDRGRSVCDFRLSCRSQPHDAVCEARGVRLYHMQLLLLYEHHCSLESNEGSCSDVRPLS